MGGMISRQVCTFVTWFLQGLALVSFCAGQKMQERQAAIPEEARKDFVQANLFFKEAQSKDDYVKSESLYQQAVKLAPQWGNAWYNLSKTQEKLEKYGDAIASLKLFLQYSPNDPETRAAQDHMYELEAKRDTQAKLIADQQRADAEMEKRVRDLEEKVDYLNQQLGGLRLETAWFCAVLREGEFPGCTDAEARGKNWHEWPPQAELGSHPKVALAGDVLMLSQKGAPMGPICIKLDDYFVGKMEFQKATCTGFESLRIMRVNLNSEWKGHPAIYVESCKGGDGDNCSRPARVYAVYSR